MNEFEVGNKFGGEAKKQKPQKGGAALFYEMLEIVAIALIAVIMINLFVGRMTTVDGSSMYPTLHDTERLWMSRLGYTPENGDIVVIQENNSAISAPIVKRIIATENQTVKFDFENWKVYVDGVLLEENYVNYEDFSAMKNYGCPEEVAVPAGYVFVMGDNRNHSTDSRDPRVGVISEDDILGKVVIRIFPLDRFGAVD